MVCNLCGVNDATIHLTEINNAQMIEIHLCETCAQEKGTEFKTHFNLNEMISGFGDASLWGSAVEKIKIPAPCPKCGLTFEELSKKGRLGCSECYHSFESLVLSLIRRVQRSTQHTGKIPFSLTRPVKGKEKDPARDLLILQERLRSSVQKEEFEEAAKLRDEIRKIEEKNKKPARAPSKRKTHG